MRSWHPGLYLHHYEPLLFSSNFLLKVFKESRTAPAAFLSKVSSSAADLLFLHCSFTPPYKFFHPSWWLQGITEKGICVVSLSWRPRTFAWGQRQKEQESQSGLSLLNSFRLSSESEHLMSDSSAPNSSILPLSWEWLQPLLWWPRRTWLVMPYC